MIETRKDLDFDIPPVVLAMHMDPLGDFDPASKKYFMLTDVGFFFSLPSYQSRYSLASSNGIRPPFLFAFSPAHAPSPFEWTYLAYS